MRLLIPALLLLCSSCSTVIVYAPDEVVIHGCDNKVELKGSELKDNEAIQDTKPEITIPFKN